MKKYTLQELDTLKRQASNGTISRSDLEHLGLDYLYTDINTHSNFDLSGNELHQEIGMCQSGLASQYRFGMRGIILKAIRDLRDQAIHDERVKNKDTRQIDHSFFVKNTFKTT